MMLDPNLNAEFSWFRKDQVKVASCELVRSNVLIMSFCSDALMSWGTAGTEKDYPSQSELLPWENKLPQECAFHM